MHSLERDDVGSKRIAVDPDRPGDPDASVVIVTYDRDVEEVQPLFEGLAAQDSSSFEVVLLDNGTGWDLYGLQDEYDFSTVYVEFDRNYHVNVGRNTGARLANGDLLLFFDDDAAPAPDCVSQHLRAHRTRDIVAARGRIRPKSSNIYGWMGPNYDLGDEPFPWPIDAEANVSIDSDAFDAVSGWDEDTFGHEGIELTSRLLDRYDTDQTIYYPDAVVYHDFIDGIGNLVRKKARHKRHKRELRRHNPELFDIYCRYDSEKTSRRADHLPTRIALYSINQLSELLAWLVLGVRSVNGRSK